MEWKPFEIIPFTPSRERKAPYDGVPFIASIRGMWVGLAIYVRKYDGVDRYPGKYEYFYICGDPEEEYWEVKIETDSFPITHWMPLPKPHNEE